MKKLFTFVITLLFCGSLAFAQATGGTPGKTPSDVKTASGKKATKSHAKKGGKKGKKSSGSTTPPPK